jgi:hypothetical protein
MRPLMALIAGVLIGAFVGCTFGVNPDEGSFSCEQDEDCGPGFECVPQSGGDSGLCFATGACAADDETCDGKDDDCNGVVDDVSWAGASCESELPGVCRPGTRACANGNSVCVATVSASVELCDGLDNDCDDAVDEDFELASDDQHCGACGNACADGASCVEGACVEWNCANVVDDDGDGLTDCEDPACLSVPCSDQEPENVCGRVPSSWLADAGTDGGVDQDAGVDGGIEDAGIEEADSGVDGGFDDAGSEDGGVDDAGMDGADAGDGGFDDDAGLGDAGLGDAGVDDAGVDGGGSSDAGEELVGACVPRENTCGNGLDDDGDGLVDCEDPDCSGLTCGDAGICSGGICQ